MAKRTKIPSIVFTFNCLSLESQHGERSGGKGAAGVPSLIRCFHVLCLRNNRVVLPAELTASNGPDNSVTCASGLAGTNPARSESAPPRAASCGIHDLQDQRLAVCRSAWRSRPDALRAGHLAVDQLRLVVAGEHLRHVAGRLEPDLRRD